MKYGFTLPGRGPLATPETLGRIARAGEDLGYDALFTGDHILVPRNIASPYPYTEGGEFPGSPSGESMEQLTLLAFLAGQTSRIRLVTSVIIVPHRNALVAAKALATLDVLSGGRLVVGVGVGWMREEFEALNLPPFEERGAVTDEYIRAFKELWTSDDPHFEGKYVSFDNISFLPKPVQKPHPPIWVGGESRPPCAAPPSWPTAGIRWGPIRRFPWEPATVGTYARRFGPPVGNNQDAPVAFRATACWSATQPLARTCICWTSGAWTLGGRDPSETGDHLPDAPVRSNRRRSPFDRLRTGLCTPPALRRQRTQ